MGDNLTDIATPPSEQSSPTEPVTTVQLIGDERVHLHQLVTNGNGVDYVVVGLDDTRVELCRLDGVSPTGDVGFGRKITPSRTEFASTYEPQTAGGTRAIPRWAY